MVQQGGGMNNPKWMKEAQDYLTIVKEGKTHLLVGIAYLSENHSIQEIIRFLKEYLRDKEKEFKQLLIEDKTSPQVDQLIAVIFRLQMAIMTLQKEVNRIVRFKRRAAGSGCIHKWNRRSHRRPRRWKDQNHDGENWQSGDRARRAA